VSAPGGGGPELQAAYDATPVPVVVILDGVFVYANEAADAFKGEPLVGLDVLAQIHPDDQPAAIERLTGLLEGGSLESALVLRIATARGWVWAEVTGFLVAWGGVQAVQAVVVDLQGRKAAAKVTPRADLDASAALFKTVISSLAEGLIVLGADGNPRTWNQASLDLLSLTEDELSRLDPTVALDVCTSSGEPLGIGGLPAAAHRLASVDTIGETTVGYRHGDGPRRWLSCATRPLPDGSTVVSFHDITTEKETADRFAHLARYDQLTGLPNRSLALERLTSALRRAERGAAGTTAVLFIDLDSFKRVNDTLGHAAGDELLVAVAERLRRAVRPEDVIARFGGDEFVLVAEGLEGVAGARALADRVCASAHPPVRLGAHDVTVSASVGIAIAAPGDTAEGLLAQADIALYRAKALGRSRHELFDETMRSSAVRRLEMEGDLRRAIAARALHVLYQPLIRPATGEVAMFEALVRWDHPALGSLQPDEFVALAEDTGMIAALGEVVLAEALADVRRWHAAGATVPVAVNLSARQLDDPDLVESVRAAVDAAQVDPSWLEIEITENAMEDPTPGALAALRSLRALGVRLSMDDFGIGSSSLAALRTLPVDSVKLDRRFQDGVETDPAARAILQAVLQLVHALGLVAVAEGVESAAQLTILADLGFDLVQGFHLAPAMAAADVPAFVAARRRAGG
jgi:diguanylate cyclase (GGDEF)-like protein/PAS domain S-box-containing protein